jgi:C1A family cysteine protease
MFTDLTVKEFKDLYLTYKSRSEHKETTYSHNGLGLPTAVDWVQNGAVTPVKNEGSKCGACWAFSTTGAVEGAWKIAGNSLTFLSEQELIDCSGSFGNQGCSGGYMDNSFKYIIAKGITSDSIYPYTGKQQDCNAKAQAQVIAKISGYTDIPVNDKNSLMGAVANLPVAVAVDATTWSSYSGGVITGNCGSNLNFAALIVGYNTLSTPNWWKVKNDWGTDWGTAGYVFIGISAGNGICGINMEASFAVVN